MSPRVSKPSTVINAIGEISIAAWMIAQVQVKAASRWAQKESRRRQFVAQSGQHREEDLREAMARDLAGRGVPPPEEPVGPATYVWGWSLVSYVVERYGPEAIARFSREPGDAALHAFLHVPEEELERSWRLHAEREGAVLAESV
jgi:hypothetical protein